MPRYENLTGQKFGRLTVIEPTEEKNKDGRRIWKCQCDCGNIKLTTCQNLKRGHCTSCGCKNKEQIAALGHSHAIDITGQRFGKLTALYPSIKKLPYSESIAWICQCDCGEQIITTVSALNSGNTKSCGCAHKSEGVELIAQFLQNNNIKFETESWRDDLRSSKGKPLQFDFYLPEYNCFIEFDGEQHYKYNRYFSLEGVERDKMKNAYCLEKNIKLYRIPYSEKQLLYSLVSLSQLINDKYLVSQVNHYDV